MGEGRGEGQREVDESIPKYFLLLHKQDACATVRKTGYLYYRLLGMQVV